MELSSKCPFASLDEYRRFFQLLFLRLNAGRTQRLIEEMAVMRELPERRIESIKRERVRVDSGSLIFVDRKTYSVPSRLIGERVDAGRNSICQPQIVGGGDAIDEDTNMALPRQRIDHAAWIGRGGLSGETVGSGTIIEAARDAAQGVVNRGAWSEVGEVLRDPDTGLPRSGDAISDCGGDAGSGNRHGTDGRKL